MSIIQRKTYIIYIIKNIFKTRIFAIFSSTEEFPNNEWFLLLKYVEILSICLKRNIYITIFKKSLHSLVCIPIQVYVQSGMVELIERAYIIAKRKCSMRVLHTVLTLLLIILTYQNIHPNDVQLRVVWNGNV